ncbi:hypothetical protein C8R46DRAFT_1345125 [Mycena filopes]|nr:hypothetical protein C8R46DRAFT_1345125 [Mycena filopes]
MDWEIAVMAGRQKASGEAESNAAPYSSAMIGPTSSSISHLPSHTGEVIPICTALLGEPFPPSLTASEDLGDRAHPSLLGTSGATYVSPSLMWDNGATITYSFIDGTTEQTRKVENTIEEWTWYANVTFSQLPPGDSSAVVRITFKGGAAWSYIGNAARGKQTAAATMALGWISDDTEFPNYERGTILHEFGHLLGLLHEHQGPAAAWAFQWKEAEVLKWYRQQGYSDVFIRNNVLFPYNETHVSNFSAYDRHSIMGYRINPEFNCEGLTANLNSDLSDMDKAYTVINYNRPTPHPKATEWTLRYALHVAGVPEEVSRHWQRPNLRQEFGRYQQATRRRYLRIKYGVPASKYHGSWLTVPRFPRLLTHLVDSDVCFYKIVCESNLSGFYPHSHVDRRYKHFEKFRKRLVGIIPPLNIPLLPPKGILVRLDERERDLLAWLELLAGHRDLERFQTLLQRFLQSEQYEL